MATDQKCWWCELGFDEESPTFKSVIHNGEFVHPACRAASIREADLDAALLHEDQKAACRHDG